MKKVAVSCIAYFKIFYVQDERVSYYIGRAKWIYLFVSVLVSILLLYSIDDKVIN